MITLDRVENSKSFWIFTLVFNIFLLILFVHVLIDLWPNEGFMSKLGLTWLVSVGVERVLLTIFKVIRAIRKASSDG